MSDGYDVGYGKPPKQSRFQKGESGNPRGRRKGSKNLATMVHEALSATVVVNLNGRRRKVSKLEAAFIQQSNKAAGGDPKAMTLMLDLLLGAQARDEAKAGGEQVAPESQLALDQKVLTALRARLGSEGQDDG